MLQELAQEKGKGLRVRLAAPTGKAAARLTASIDQAAREFPEDMPQLQMVKKAATLHRLMGSRPDSRHFVHNAQNPLHVDLLIVDEASMVDLEMMSALLDALPADSEVRHAVLGVETLAHGGSSWASDPSFSAPLDSPGK